MLITINVHQKTIQLNLEKHVIQVFIDDSPNALLASDTKKVTAEIVNSIKERYSKLFGQELYVPHNSMMVEIWGHAYADKFAKAVKSRFNIAFIHKITEKIIRHAEVIDIGERSHDPNRFVWDALSYVEPVIALFLPKHKKRQN